MLDFKITKLNRLLADDFVCDVYYTVVKKDAGYSASIDSTMSFVKQTEKTLVAYSDLTENMVINWVKDSIDADSLSSIDAFLARNILDQKMPKAILGTPWAQ